MQTQNPTETCCLACGSRNAFSTTRILDQGTIKTCPVCGFAINDDVIPESLGGDIFETESFRWVKRQILKHEFGYLRHVAPRVFLEIGSGSGELAGYLKSMGHDVVCCDLGQESLNIIKERYGLRTIFGDIMAIDLRGTPYTAIVMRHVFEHMLDPEAFFRKLTTTLPVGGHFVVTQPNLDSWSRKVSGDDWNWTVPIHRTFWTEKTLRLFLEKRGFRVTRSRTVFSHLGMPMALTRKLPKGIIGKLLKPFAFLAGCFLELVAVSLFHAGQNVFVEAEKVTEHYASDC